MVRFTQVGYSTEVIEVNISEINVRSTVVLSSIRELETIEVYGKSQGEEQEEKGFQVDIVKLKNQQNITSDINQILKTTSGINIRESGGLGSDFVLSLNGLSGNQIRYFIDGVPMENFGSALTLNNFPIGLVESVEVYKGAIPIHLSADALGGAINIITNKTLKSFIDAGYSFGSFQTNRISLNSRYVFKNRTSISVSSFFNSTANNYWMDSIPVYDLELGNSHGYQRVQRWHDQYKSGMARIEFVIFKRKWVDKFAISATVAANRKNYQHPNNNLTKIFNDLHTINKTGLFTLNYSKRIKKIKITAFSTVGFIEESIIDTGDFKFNWNADYIQRDSTDPSGELFELKSYFIQTDFILRNQVGGSYDLNEQHNLESHYNSNYLIRNGNDLVNEFNISFESPNYIRKDILSLGYTFKSKNERVKTNVFVKQYWFSGKIITQDYDSNEIISEPKSTNLGCGLAMSYQLNKVLRLKSSIEKAYRIPEAFEVLGDGIYINPNPNLLPENSLNYNGGLSIIKQIRKLEINSSSNFFYRLSDNFIRFNPLGPFGQFENLQRTQSVGIESGLKLNWNRKFLVSINATYQNITDKAEFDEGLPNINYQSRIPNVPWLFGNASIGYQMKIKNESQRMQFNLSTNYIHEFFLKWKNLGSSFSKHIIPTQFVQDFNIEYSFGKGKYNTSLTVQNIFNKTVYDNFSIPRTGRTIYMKIRCQLINNK